ncbi:hypothetical protein J2802_005814 [Paraburkholderia caribensis]|jgi:hypothetical protein|nr:hypothetical protein [Paraburkholderia caribensis]
MSGLHRYASDFLWTVLIVRCMNHLETLPAFAAPRLAATPGQRSEPKVLK